MRYCSTILISLWLFVTPSSSTAKTHPNPLIKALMAMADLDSSQAAVLLDSIIQNKTPLTAKASLLKAKALVEGGKLEKAKLEFKKLTKSSNRFIAIGARFGLSECFEKQKDFKHAESEFSLGLCRLSSSEFRQYMAERFERLGDEAMEPGGAQKAPAPDTARTLFLAALELNLPKEATLRLWLKAGNSMEKSGQHLQAAKHFLTYLRDKKYKDYPGKIQVTLAAAKSLIKSGQMREARLLLKSVEKKSSSTSLSAEISWLMTRTFDLPAPHDPIDLLRAMAALKKFIKAFPHHSKINQARLELLTAPTKHLNWTALSQDEARSLISEGGPDDLMAEARFVLAQSLLRQERYEQAAKVFNQYLKKHPTHRYWSNARKGIEDAHWHLAIRLENEKKWNMAASAFSDFAKSHPASKLTPRALFYSSSAHLKAKSPDAALDVLKLLTSKFADTQWGWKGVVTKARILIEQKGQYKEGLKLLEKAASAKNPNVESQSEAQQELDMLEAYRLLVKKPKNFRTNQRAYITWNVKNIKEVTIRAYRIDAEDYFKDQLDMSDLTSVDIGLCQPDKTWKIKVKGYKRFVPIEQRVDLPFKKPGVYLLNLTAKNLQATTAVRISDLGLIIKQGSGQVFVFAQDLLHLKALADSQIILTDGRRILAQGLTGNDGTWKTNLDADKLQDTIFAFGKNNENVAWTDYVNSPGYSRVKKAPASFVFTDRPAYSPGDRVSIAGIFRKRTNGRLSFSAGDTLMLKVTAPDGRDIESFEVALDDYGTFHKGFQLDDAVTQGTYYFHLNCAKWGQIKSGSFQVIPHQALPYDMTINLDHDVLVRGEPITGEVRVLHAHGAPAPGIKISCGVTGGKKTITSTTDKNGNIRFSFPSDEISENQDVEITAMLEQDSQKATGRLFVAASEFNLRMKPQESTFFAGQEFSLELKAIKYTGKPTAAKVHLQALAQGAKKRGEVRLWIKDIRIPASGTNTIKASVSKPGSVILRATSSDELGNLLVVEKIIQVVAEKKPGLWLEVQGDPQVVGRPMKLTIHSRLQKALVLLTGETQTICSHSSVIVHKGENKFSLPLDTALAPNFLLSASAMQDHEFYQSSLKVSVDRVLSLQMRSDRDQYEPGQEVSLTIIARDAAGKPADARLLVSVVDAMLLKQYPEVLPPLLETFYPRRKNSFFASSSSATVRFSEAEAKPVEKMDVRHTEGSAVMNELASRRKEMTQKGAGAFRQMAEEDSGGIGGLGSSGYGSGGGGLGTRYGRVPRVMRQKVVVSGSSMKTWRQNFDESAIFRYDVSTGPDGVATLRFKLPDSITRWRVAARATTRETLLGQSFLELSTMKSLFAKLLLPAEFKQGDGVYPMARIYNYTGIKTTAALQLVSDGKTFSEKVRLPPNAVVEHIFPEVIVSQGNEREKTFKLISESPGYEDRLIRRTSVNPRGFQVESAVEGWTNNNASRSISLRPGSSPTSMEIQISNKLHRFFIGNNLDELLFSDDPNNALVALRLLELVGPKAQSTEVAQVRRKLRTALVHIQSIQKSDGGWGWSRGSSDSNIRSTCAAVRALCLAKPIAGKIAWIYPDDALSEAQHWLQSQLSRLAADELTERARIVYALSHISPELVPAVVVQRLQRLRTSLPIEAKALLGLTWLTMKRTEDARRVAATIDKKQLHLDSMESQWSWGESFEPQYAGRMRALELLAKLHLADQVIQETRRRLPGNPLVLNMYSPGFAELTLGVIAALEAEDNRGLPARVEVKVNGKKAGVLKTDNLKTFARLEVPLKLLKKGDNKIEISSNTMGSIWFRATMKGFMNSTPGQQQGDDQPVIISRHLEPVPDAYEGVAIKGGFSVVNIKNRWFNDVKTIARGKRLKVTINLDRSVDSPLDQDHTVLMDDIPPGFKLLSGPPSGQVIHMAQRGNRLAFYLGTIYKHMEISYILVAVYPGSFSFAPPRLRSLLFPEAMLIGRPHSIKISTTDNNGNEIRSTPDELFHRGMAAAELNNDQEVLDNLEALWRGFEIKDAFSLSILEKLLFASIHLHDHQRIIKYFELTKEKNPSLLIPFENIEAVQKAYRAMGIYEGGLHLDKGAALALFSNQITAIGRLESLDQIAEATDLLNKLLLAFPRNYLNAKAAYAFSQVIFQRADRIAQGHPLEGFDRPGLLDLVVDLMADFIGRYPGNPQAPAAIFSIASALMEKKRAKDAIAWCEVGLRHHKDSDLAPALAYLEAFAHFSLGHYKRSMDLCKQVIATAQNSRQVAMAQYIMAQIYHARGQIGKAIQMYSKVSHRFIDAQETIDELQRSWIRVPDVVRIPRGHKASLEITAYNTPSVDIKVYNVNLMKLYLLKGSLDNLEDINLAGIRPIDQKEVLLHATAQDGTQVRKVSLNLPGKGAYLVLVRGTVQVHPSLVLVDALGLDVTELQDEGRARVAVRNSEGKPLAGAKVEIKGFENQQFMVGNADLRGIFIADKIQGRTTVIAEHKGSYGLFRGKVPMYTRYDDQDNEDKYRKNSRIDFDEESMDGRLYEPSTEYLMRRKKAEKEEYNKLFNQQVKGMAVQQAL